MRLRETVVNRARDELPVRLLFVKPDADPVRRAADHVVAAVAVHVVNMHLRALVAKIGRDEFPVRLSRVGGSLPVACANNHVVTPVAVDVADSESMRVSENAAFFRLLLGKLLADRVGDEFGARVLARLVPGHLRIVEREDQRGILPGAVQLCKRRTFVAGVAEQRVFDPVLVFAFRVLVPDDAMRSGHVYANLVGPTVVVDVGGEVNEGVAVTFGRVELLDWLNLMRCPVRRFVPQIARDHIRLAVAVDVGDRGAFRPELAVERDLLEPDLSRRFLRACAGVKLARRRQRRQGEANRQNAVNAAACKSLVHLPFSGKDSTCELARNIYSLYLWRASFHDQFRYSTGSQENRLCRKPH